jgi:D-sedoheptulose 7-phosphate isomerase
MDERRRRVTGLDRAIEAIIVSLRSGGTLYACGNGGSDAHAGHLVAELIGRYAYDRHPLRAVHLSSGGPVGSCIANDYGWPNVYARQVAALCTPVDVLVVFSTSGQSSNIVNAANACRGQVVAFLGPGPLGTIIEATGRIEVHSLSKTTPWIQEDHQRWVHEVARRVEEAMCPK